MSCCERSSAFRNLWETCLCVTTSSVGGRTQCLMALWSTPGTHRNEGCVVLCRQSSRWEAECCARHPSTTKIVRPNPRLAYNLQHGLRQY